MKRLFILLLHLLTMSMAVYQRPNTKVIYQTAFAFVSKQHLSCISLHLRINLSFIFCVRMSFFLHPIVFPNHHSQTNSYSQFPIAFLVERNKVRVRGDHNRRHQQILFRGTNLILYILQPILMPLCILFTVIVFTTQTANNLIFFNLLCRLLRSWAALVLSSSSWAEK